MNVTTVEVIEENKVGSTKQLNKIKEQSEIVKDILITIAPIVFMVILAVVILARWLFK